MINVCKSVRLTLHEPYFTSSRKCLPVCLFFCGSTRALSLSAGVAIGAAVAFAAARRTTTVAHRVHQTILEPPHGNALQACAASILGLPLNLVPNFVEEVDYWDAMLQFAALRGLTLIKVNLDGGLLPHKTRPGTLCIARGSSPRGSHAHVTVAMVTCDGRALELAHDPHPTGDGLADEPSWAAFFVPASRFA